MLTQAKIAALEKSQRAAEARMKTLEAEMVRLGAEFNHLLEHLAAALAIRVK